MASDRRPPRAGDTLAGKYRLERALGSGGTGTVFRAVDVAARRAVAVKVMHGELARDGARVARFLREAKAVSMVHHPNVVEVVDHGVGADGTPFIVQELLAGTTLAKHLSASGRLPVGEALRIVLPVVEAIAHAHARGVIHRDLNPANVFLTGERGARATIPKVLDFGISKIKADTSMTASASGMTMGTPAYMPPEQVRSARSADARADVWAIGVILFEMVSGRLPFVETDTASMFVEICTATAPRLDTVAPGVPEALAAVVERCLRPRREDRYADASALLDALRRVVDGLPAADRDGEGARAGTRAGVRPRGETSGGEVDGRSPGRRRLGWALAALALLALLAVVLARAILR